MTIDEEIKIWTDRSNDEFGTILKQIKKLASEVIKDIFHRDYEEYEDYEECNDYLTHYIALYAMNGNRKDISNKIENFLKEYDLTGEGYDEIDNLVKKLKNLV